MADGRSPMETMDVDPGFWRNKRVFLTGHTGFKGGWLALWLQEMGSEVYGYALHPSTEPSLYTVAGIGKKMTSSVIADIRDYARLHDAIQQAKPDIAFHLAAQPLVQYGYAHPAETYAVNVMGTVHLLEAVRAARSVKAVINITTDKCYENREWLWGYRENEAMGGFDPYSSSKGCAELVTSAYRRSFLAAAGIAVASARAGNVIGGGDWSKDRLVPDILHSLSRRQPVVIRNPTAIRPWQHVLEPLAGYLLLGQQLYVHGADYAEAWNFGPSDDEVMPVQDIVETMAALWGDEASWVQDKKSHPHEATILTLDSSKARARLNWRPKWNNKTALRSIVDWYRAYQRGDNMQKVMLEQIASYIGSSKYQE